VISSLRRDGAQIERHLRWGVYVTFTAEDDYTRRCLAEYGGLLDAEGRYSVLYRPNHYIGLELPISVLSVALHGRSTGTTREQHADVVAVAKRNLAAGSELDGEGGYCAWGRVVPIATSLGEGALPMGLADGRRLVRDVAAGETLRWRDVEEPDVGDELVSLRRRIERALA
jgi:predicted homoserine dehydrogenase-like protein